MAIPEARPSAGDVRPPRRLSETAAGLERLRVLHRNDLERAQHGLHKARGFLKIADAVGEALETLSEQLFEQALGLLQ